MSHSQAEVCVNCGVDVSSTCGQRYNRRPLYYEVFQDQTVCSALQNICVQPVTPLPKSKKASANTKYMCNQCTDLLGKICKFQNKALEAERTFRERTFQGGGLTYVGRKNKVATPQKALKRKRLIPLSPFATPTSLPAP